MCTVQGLEDDCGHWKIIFIPPFVTSKGHKNNPNCILTSHGVSAQQLKKLKTDVLNCACVVQLGGLEKPKSGFGWGDGSVVTAPCLYIVTINESELQELVLMMPPHFIDQEIKCKLVSAAAGSCHRGFVWCGRGALHWGIYGVFGSPLKPWGVRAREYSPEQLCVFIVILTLEQDLS